MKAMVIKLTVIYKADLNDANSLDALQNLENECGQTKSLIAAIEDFISSSSTRLHGTSWDSVRSKLSLYLNALNLRYSIASSLAGDIKKANNSLSSYMGPYTELNTQYLEELNRLRVQYKNNLYNARTQYINLLNFTMEEVEQEKNIYVALREINRYSNLVSELDSKIEKIEGLEMADINAYSTLSSAIVDIAAYNAQVSSIVPSSNITSNML